MNPLSPRDEMTLEEMFTTHGKVRLPNANPPRRTASDILHAIRANLTMVRDCTALKLAACKPGPSSFKSTAGLLRGFQEALGVIDSEWGR